MLRTHDTTFRVRLLISLTAVVVLVVIFVMMLVLRSHRLVNEEGQSRIAALVNELRQKQSLYSDRCRNQVRLDAEASLIGRGTSLASIGAELVARPLVDGDQVAIDELCRTLGRDAEVVLCFVTSTDGLAKASYCPEMAASNGNVLAFADRLRRERRAIEIRRPVLRGGQRIGEVVVFLRRTTLDEAQANVGEDLQHLEGSLRSLYLNLDSEERAIFKREVELLWQNGLIAGLVAMVIGFACALAIAASVARPLREAVEVLEAVAAGDLTKRLNFHGRGELGRMATALNTAVASQARNLLAVQAASEREKRQSDELRSEVMQRERAQQELLRAKDAAEAANQSKSQFLANMSHEIRTPLGAILGFAKVLLAEAGTMEPEQRCDHLRTIYASGRHLLSLIDDVLDLSKIEAGRMVVEQVACSPFEIVSEVISVLRVRSSEHGLYLRTEWPGGVPATIQSDPARLRQLLMNLVGNAIKFTPQGGVEVIGHLIREGEPRLVLRVRDTGIGIPDDRLEDIFDPFVQADASVTRQFGGTGLGLSISRKIAEALGGSLTVSSVVGQGSTFTAILPTGSLDGVDVLAVPPVDGLRARVPKEVGCALHLPPARILLVEDGSTNRKLITLILSRAGATVVTAENGQIGVDIASSADFDLILMDMQMPVLDGYSATRQLRDRGLELPIIALTAHAMSSDERKCREAGCSGYLSKPIDPEVLVQAVAQALAKGGMVLPAPVASAEVAAGAAAVTNSANPEPADGFIRSSLPLEDPDFAEIADDFQGRLREQLATMHEAIDAEDMTALARFAHWLKGSGGTAGYGQFTAPAKRLEQVARDKQCDAIEAAIAEIMALADRVLRCPTSESAKSSDSRTMPIQ